MPSIQLLPKSLALNLITWGVKGNICSTADKRFFLSHGDHNSQSMCASVCVLVLTFTLKSSNYQESHHHTLHLPIRKSFSSWEVTLEMLMHEWVHNNASLAVPLKIMQLFLYAPATSLALGEVNAWENSLSTDPLLKFLSALSCKMFILVFPSNSLRTVCIYISN